MASGVMRLRHAIALVECCVLCNVGALGFSAGAAAAEWKVTPSVEVGETYTDNVALAEGGSGTGGAARSDFITTISPGLRISADGARLKLRLDYDPQALIFARNPSSSTVQQRLLGTGQAELYKEALFFEASASVSQSFLDNAGPVATTTLTNNSNLQTVQTYMASPYLRHHFGSFADSESRYRFTTVTAGGDTVAPVRTHELRQKFTSGEYFGRLGWALTADAIRYERLGGTSDPLGGTTGKDDLLGLDLRYAVRAGLSVIGRIGYERVSDPSLLIPLSGLVWNAGFQYAPSRALSVKLTYGRRFFRSDVGFEAKYDIGPQTHLFASYVQALQTGETRFASGLDQLALGPNGAFVNARTGLPFTSDTSVFGISSAAFIDKRFQVELRATRGRNTYAAAAYDESRVQDAPAGTEKIHGGTLGWSRQLRRTLALNLGATYEHTTFGDGSGRRDTLYSISAGLAYRLSPTATAQLSVLRSSRQSNEAGQDIDDNIVTVSFRKQF